MKGIAAIEWITEYAKAFSGESLDQPCKLWSEVLPHYQSGEAKAWNHWTEQWEPAVRVIWRRIYNRPFPHPKVIHMCNGAKLGCVSLTHIAVGDEYRKRDTTKPIDRTKLQLIDELSKSTILSICREVKRGKMLMGEIAQKYNVSKDTVSLLWNGKARMDAKAPRRPKNLPKRERWTEARLGPRLRWISRKQRLVAI